MRINKPGNDSQSQINNQARSHDAIIQNQYLDFDHIKPNFIHQYDTVHMIPNVTLSEELNYLVWINGKIHSIEGSTGVIDTRWRVELARSGSVQTGIDLNNRIGYSLYEHTFDQDDQYCVWALSDDDNDNFIGFAYTLVPRTTFSAVSNGAMGSLATYTVADAYRFREKADVCVSADGQRNYGTITDILNSTTIKIKMYFNSSFWGGTPTNITSTTDSEIIQINKFYPWNGASIVGINDKLYTKNYRLIYKSHLNGTTNTIESKLPLGSIIAWHKNWTTYNQLPEGWEECDGTGVSDRTSLMYGITKPDLNGDERFLRGGSTSGTLQAATEHLLLYIDSNGGSYSYTNATNNGAALNVDSYTGTGKNPGDFHTRDSTAGSGIYTRYTSRPVNMSVVYIIKVR